MIVVDKIISFIGFKVSVDPTSIEVYENATNNEINILLVQLDRQFERLKRRIKRHGVKYLTKYSIDDNTETPAGKHFDKTIVLGHKVVISGM